MVSMNRSSNAENLFKRKSTTITWNVSDSPNHLRRLEMFFSQLPKNATTARVKMLADKEYEEALNRCVKHIYDSLTIYQVRLLA